MIKDILKEAISIEIYGQEYYSIFSKLVSDENAKALFRGLDEEEHKELLEKEYRNILGEAIDINALSRENIEKARNIFPESLDNIIDTKDVLKLGIRTEERSIEFYSNSAKQVDNPSSKDLFLKLIRVEEGHKTVLEEALYYLEQEATWYGYSPTIEGYNELALWYSRCSYKLRK